MVRNKIYRVISVLILFFGLTSTHSIHAEAKAPFIVGLPPLFSTIEPGSPSPNLLNQDDLSALIVTSKEIEIHKDIIPSLIKKKSAIDLTLDLDPMPQIRSEVSEKKSLFAPQRTEKTLTESLLLDPKLPLLPEIWTVNDIYDPPQILVIPEFGGNVISTYGAGNAIAVDPLFRRAQGLGIAPDWYGVGVSWAGAVGNLISTGRNIGITNVGIAFNDEEDPSHTAPFIGFSTSVAISYDSDPPNTIKPTNILIRTMAGIISHYEK